MHERCRRGAQPARQSGTRDPSYRAAVTNDAAPCRWSQIYYKANKDAAWERVDGGAVNVSVSACGDHVWVCNEGNDIFYRAGRDGAWEQIGGALTRVSVSANGMYVVGVNSGDEIFYKIGGPSRNPSPFRSPAPSLAASRSWG